MPKDKDPKIRRFIAHRERTRCVQPPRPGKRKSTGFIILAPSGHSQERFWPNIRRLIGDRDLLAVDESGQAAPFSQQPFGGQQCR